MGNDAASSARNGASLRVVRIMLLVMLLLGLLGTGLELLLLEHTEDVWQLIPVILIGWSLVACVWYAAGGGRASARTFQATMILCIVSGVMGLGLHYRGNVEFELEMHPTLAGLELFRAAISGATPALAPGTMIALGLVGLTYTLAVPPTGGSHEEDEV